MSPTKGIPVSDQFEESTPSSVPTPDEPSIPELEDDQTIAPRPEEEIADVLRAKPDTEDHRQPE
jgi:hypothetical protein